MGSVAQSIGGVLGIGGNPFDFKAQAAPIVNPLEEGQLKGAYDYTNQALQGQQALAQQLGQAGGIQNQADVYRQLQQIASGQGPNPAQAMLAQSTGQNVANQAALMAGQRGASSNAGLIARQAAQAGGTAQQQAAGQAAALQAQQAMNAIQQAGGIAGQQVANQMAGQGALTSAGLQQQGQLMGAQQGFNQAQLANTQQQNQINQAMAAANAQRLAGALGGAFNAVGGLGGIAGGLGSMGSKIGGLFGAGSGATSMAGGAEAADLAGVAALAAHGGMIPDHLTKMHEHYHGEPYAHGGQIPIIVSPGEKYIPPQEAKEVAKGHKSIAQAGHKIPGQAKVDGDSYKNDTVPMKAEAGGIVIPRSVMQSKDPVKEGTKFLIEAMKKHGGHKEKSDFHHALKKAISKRG
jgi:hypothetical protein